MYSFEVVYYILPRFVRMTSEVDCTSEVGITIEGKFTTRAWFIL